jgi:hypothetical protein
MITILSDFLPIFGEKNGVFLKNQWYDPFLAAITARNAKFWANSLTKIFPKIRNTNSITYVNGVPQKS